MIESLRSLLGADAVTDDPESCQRAVASWHPARLKQAANRVAAVATPPDTQALAALVRWANDHRIRLHPRGGGSNVTGFERSPDTIAVDLVRFQTLQWDETALLVTAGAGWTLGALEERLNAHGYTLGQFPGSARLATIGGAVAMNAIGCLSGRYGRQRALTRAVEAVLPQGQILRTSPTPGADAAFDLSSLLIGSEGAFGIITAATLRLFPQPDVRAWAVFGFDQRRDAIDALRLTYRCDARPAVARLLEDNTLLLGFEGDEIVQTGHFQLAHAVCQRVGGKPLDPELAEHWFERQSGDLRWQENARPGALADTLALGATWTHLEDVETRVRQALEGRVDRLATEIAHPEPTGAALEVTFTLEADDDDTAIERHRRLIAAVTEVTIAAGGTVAHHLGIGSKLRAAWTQERDQVERATLQAIKAALDPNAVFPPCP